MSGQSPVSPARKLHDADVVYLYDGSFEGFLCCVFESFAQHELPLRSGLRSGRRLPSTL